MSGLDGRIAESGSAAPFAADAAKARAAAEERDAKRRAAWRERLGRLVADADFRAWFAFVDRELCGAAFGQNELDAFTQGKRATMDFIRGTLAVGDGAPEFLAELTRAHYRAIAEARLAARTNRKEN